MIHHQGRLAEAAEHTAEWRRHVGQRFPGDERNADAAERLRALAADIRTLPADDETVIAYEAAMSRADRHGALHEVTRAESDLLRQVGFADGGSAKAILASLARVAIDEAGAGAEA